MTKISALSDIGTSVAANDVFVLVDVSDPTTPNKKVQQQNLFLIPDGDATTPGIRFLSDTNTGLFRATTDTLAFATNGSERLRISSTGLVGIGTSSPDATLHISKALVDGDTLLRIQPTSFSAGFSVRQAFTRGSTDLVRFTVTSDAGNADKGSLLISTSSTTSTTNPVVIFTGDGRVGIGTTNASSLLHLRTANSGTPQAALRIEQFNAATTRGHRLEITVDPDNDIVRYNATGDGAGNHVFQTGGNERARIDSSGRLLVGTSSARTEWSAGFQVEGGSNANLSIIRNAAGATQGPTLVIGRSRTTAIGGVTAVQNGDTLGFITFVGANGTDISNQGASISAVVDADPFSSGDTTDLPSRLVLSVTSDGSSAVTEALRITNDRVVCCNQPAPTSKSAAATLTVAELKTGIIQYTGAADTLTLPTGTLTEGGFSGIYTNMTFEWSVINTGSGTCTIGAGTDHTIVGAATVAAGDSGRFASRRTAANTFVSYRLS